MEVFKDVIIKCEKNNGFEHERNVSYSCGTNFTISEDDVYAVDSIGYFGEDITEYYAMCPRCGYINKLDENMLPDYVKKAAIYKSKLEPFLYKKNNLRSELIYLDMVSPPPILKKVR